MAFALMQLEGAIWHVAERWLCYELGFRHDQPPDCICWWNLRKETHFIEEQLWCDLQVLLAPSPGRMWTLSSMWEVSNLSYINCLDFLKSLN